MVRLGEDLAAALASVEPPDPGLGTTGKDYLAVRSMIEQLEVAGLRLLAAFDASGTAAAEGSASTAAWVRRRTGCSGRTVAADVQLARRLHTDPVRPLTTTAELLGDGQLSIGHARAIARATAALTTGAFATAEPLLVLVCGHHHTVIHMAC